MHLERLELSGFKSFADRTVLDFLSPSVSSQGITAVVGPNGSGKSNVADAIRWVLGEQSLKLLRGKKAEDVIFSGSEKRGRSGFAEVVLHLNNEDGKIPVDYSQISVSRRVYRDGESEYFINKGKVRLADVHLLLAQAQIGSRSYAVIGQGMADGILAASPEERKEFFDEAAGIRQFQIKRNQAQSRLAASRENLAQAELLVAEIEPRLRSLSRQVERLKTRETIEEDLHAAKHQYYGRQWQELQKELRTKSDAVARAEKEWQGHDATIAEAKAGLEALRQSDQPKADTGWSSLQKRYEALVEERSALQQRQFQLQGKIDVAREVRRQVATPLPLSKIIEEVAGAGALQGKALSALKAAATLEAAHATVPTFEQVRVAAATLAERLERPAVETAPAKQEADPAFVAELEKTAGDLAKIQSQIAACQEDLQKHSSREKESRAAFFELQRRLEERMSAAHAAERRMSDARVDMARVETRRDSLEQEMSAELGESRERAKSAELSETAETLEQLQGRIQKLRYQLELIGGIDPEAVREYEDTKARHEFLASQTDDLHRAIGDLEHVIAELDVTIAGMSSAAFKAFNRDFARFFGMLFGGGKAELVEVTAQPEDASAEDEEVAQAQPKNAPVTGIDIVAHPPGKKIANIAMLSGGERALIAIALISAIMVSNPSPFVVLDEVDAALDEANAQKFASIVSELSGSTQFIVITHNRYTMAKANVLYGVTMRTDGTSQLLSMHLDEIDKLREKTAKVS